jgi:hypothetical protein
MKAAVLIKKLLGVPVVTQSRTGFLIALILGEAISNAVLVAVDSEHAVVAMEGQTNVLALQK